MRASRSTLMAAVLVVVALTMVPAIGSAVQTAPALQSLRAGMGVASSGGQQVLSITGRLPDSASLPATIVIPFPNGLTPSWVGEIAGADPSKDPTAKYTIKTGPKFSTMTITLTQNRVGQAEFNVQTAVANGGTQYAADLPILGKVGEVTLEIGVPTGSTVASISTGLALATSSGGIDIYSITKKSPQVGTTVSAVVVAAAAPAAVVTASPSGSTAATAPSELTSVLVIALSALAGFIGVYLFQSSKEKRLALAASQAGPSDPPASARDQAPAQDRSSPSKRAAKRAAREREERAARDARALANASGAGEAFGDDEDEPAAGSSAEPESEEESVVASPQSEDGFDEDDDEEAAIAGEDDEPAEAAVASPCGPPADDIVGQVKELVALKAAGTLDADEFAAAKHSLLAGETRVVALLEELSRFERNDLLTAEEFVLAKEQLLTGSTEMIVGIEDLAELERQGLLSRDEFRTVVDRLLAA